MDPVETIIDGLGSDRLVDVDEATEAGRPALAQRDTRRIGIYCHRQTIGPFVNRHDAEGDTIRCRIDDRDHIRVPPRKWKSMEKLRGLQLCRAYGLVDPDYRYNNVSELDQLNNPMSVIFGDTVAESSESAGIPSLAVYEQGISAQIVRNATQKLTHNALGEAGTMWDTREGEYRTSLFDTLYVTEGTDFLQSITLDAPVPEAVALLLMCLDARRYGAGKQVLGSNMDNKVLGIFATSNEPPVTPYSIVKEVGSADSAEKVLDSYVHSIQQWDGAWMPAQEVAKVRDALRSDSDARKQVLKRLADAAEAYHEFVYYEDD